MRYFRLLFDSGARNMWFLDEPVSKDGRPEKVGQYLMVTNLTINPDRTDGQDIFRIRGWEIALIVSEEIKRSIEGMPNLGVVFDPVC